ncbi:MAG: tyrosine--tRNA ligase [Armatimonadota bacterium]
MDIDKQMDIIKRGTLEIISGDELKKKLLKSRKEEKPLRIKLGIDPTAPDVHLGFAVVLRKLRAFQDLGHHVVLIIGDFTALIGDPSGRSVTRPMLTKREIDENAKTYMLQFSRILDPNKTEVVYNSSWLSKMTLLDMVQLTSKYTVARILERDDFEKRYKESHPIGMHEILYPLLQGYDSVAVHSDVELGGLDQKFNILVGRELQREYSQEPQVALFMPILEGLDGVQKMSKSLGNYIGITESPDDMFGKIMSIPDSVMFKYYELCTDVPADEISELEKGVKNSSLHPKDIKKRLAKEIIKIYHSEEAGNKAEEEFEKIFSRGELPTSIREVILGRDDLKDGKVWIVKLLMLAELAESKREARRLVSQGAVIIDNERVNDVELDVIARSGMVVKVGSRHFAQIKVGV